LPKVQLFVLAFFIASSISAQNKQYPWAFSIGISAIDSQARANGGKNWFDSHFSHLVKVSDNWNIPPYPSYLSVSRSVGGNLTIGLKGSINKWTKFLVFDPNNPDSNLNGYVVVNPGNLDFYGLDANIRFSFMNLLKSKTIEPSMSLGTGFTVLEKNSYATFNPEAGLTFWFTKNIGLALTTTYRTAFNRFGGGVEQGNDYVPKHPSHFQHTAGIIFLLDKYFVMDDCKCTY
jgi:OmpA-OmpF porin, OOP family